MSESAAHDAEGARVFIDQWAVYDNILRRDYMGHERIHVALREALVETRFEAFSVLDLGCGDASHLARTLRGLPVQSYTGVDMSPVALEKAAEYLADAPWPVTLVEADFVDYLEEEGPDSDEAQDVDVVVAAFSVHHLQPEEKPTFLRACRARMVSGGDLFICDVFRRPGESRAAYLDAYVANFTQHWIGLPAEHGAVIEEHIRAYDFPETYSDFEEMASAAGFAVPPGPIYADAEGFHTLCRFTAV